MALAFASFRTYVFSSLLLASAVVSHAAYNKRFFYRTMVYLGQSKLAIFTAANLALVSVILLWKIVQKIFLGPLRFREVERLNSRARNAIIECCFATTIFRDEVNYLFLALVTTLLMLKSLHWLSKDRMDFLEEQPLSPRIAHVRLVGLMSLLLCTDLYLVWECAKTTFQSRGGTMLVLFAFEFTVLLIDLLSDFVRYIFHVIDLRQNGRWDDKGLYSFYNELVTDMCQLTVYLAFFLYVNTYYTFPIHILREVYVTFTKFQRRCSDFIRYRRVVSTMNDRFPDATEEELADGDRTCIICREEMPEAKKLACGHMFHARCLQSWLKRQLSCPTCRSNVDVNPLSAENGARAPAGAPMQPGVGAPEAPGAADAGAAPPNDGRVPPPPDDVNANGPGFWQQANRLWQHIAYGAPRDGAPMQRPPDVLEQAQARAQQPRGGRGFWPNIRFGLRVERRQIAPRWAMPPGRPQNGAPPAPGQMPDGYQMLPVPQMPNMGNDNQAPFANMQLPPMPQADWALHQQRPPVPALDNLPQYVRTQLPDMLRALDQAYLQQPQALNQLIAIQENIGAVRNQLDTLRDQVQRLVVEATDAMAAAAAEQAPDAQTAPIGDVSAGVPEVSRGFEAANEAPSMNDGTIEQEAVAVQTESTAAASNDGASFIADEISAAGSGDSREQESLRQKRLAFLDKKSGEAGPSSGGPSGSNGETRVNHEDWM